MREQATRSVTFTEEDVEEWCDENNDPNPIHTDELAARDSSFGQRVVPGMMLMDQLSGLLTSLGEGDEEIILAGITAARFRDPVLLGEEVTFEVSDPEERTKMMTLEFECRVEERDSLVANGALSIAVK